MKVIFLDIDGVLNCEDGFRSKICTERDDYGMLFYPPSERLINKLIDETGAKVVISSTWRMSGLDAMQWMWKTRGMSGEVIDITPIMRGWDNDEYNHEGEIRPIRFNMPRGAEIDTWLDWKGFSHIFWSKERQKEYMDKSGLENYIIIDDDSDMLYKQKEHFVHVKPAPRNIIGFNEEHYLKAKEILSKDIIEMYF
jgi:hypothetical protein